MTAEQSEAEALARLLQAIKGCARGNYQLALLAGEQTWSGSSLRGSASEWGAKYRRSRDALLHRIIKAVTPLGADVGWVDGTPHTGPSRLAITLGQHSLYFGKGRTS
jgi:hypothetical protein